MTGKSEIEVIKNGVPVYRTVAPTATDAFNEFNETFVKPKRYKLRLSENDQVMFHTDEMPLHEAVMVLFTYITSKYAAAWMSGRFKVKV
jgi:hypothetical protein